MGRGPLVASTLVQGTDATGSGLQQPVKLWAAGLLPEAGLALLVLSWALSVVIKSQARRVRNCSPGGWAASEVGEEAQVP
jgi:hypothetical protein